MQYQFIKKNGSRFSVEEMCECFGLGRSGYYDWNERNPSKRALADQQHKDRIQELQRKAGGRYGHRPIYAHLQDEGVECGRDRTLRLMKELGIEGIQKKGYKPQGTDSNHQFGYSPNLLKKLVHPKGLDEVWVADTTYLKIKGVWCYLATVMDLFSRRIIGWSVSASNNSELVCQAFQSAVFERGGPLPKGIIQHSDRGSTYASHKYRRMLSGIRSKQSMSAKGNCYDNAAMESFYGRYKTSSVRTQVFEDENQARANAFEYIEIFYNRIRKHSSLGYKSPVEFESEILPPMGGSTAASSQPCVTNN